MPTSLHVILEGELLSNGVAELRLVNNNKIGGRIVIVHQQVIFQVLVTGIGVKIKALTMILHSQTRINHMTAILTLMVLIGFRHYPTALWIENTIRIGMLINVLIISHPIEREVICGLIHKAQTAAGLIHIIGTLASERVLPKSVGAIVECSHRESKFVVYFIIMADLDITVHAGTKAKINVCALIAHRILGVLAH